MIVVHFMQYGHTACLINGPVSEWPEGHRWSGDWAVVNCGACQAMRDYPTTFAISEDGKTITCLKCKLTSHNQNDVANHYCGHCHVFHDDLYPPARKAWLEESMDPLPVRRYPYERRD